MSTNKVSIGKTTDSFEHLQILSQKEVEKLPKHLTLKTEKNSVLDFGLPIFQN